MEKAVSEASELQKRVHSLNSMLERNLQSENLVETAKVKHSIQELAEDFMSRDGSFANCASASCQ